MILSLPPPSFWFSLSILFSLFLSSVHSLSLSLSLSLSQKHDYLWIFMRLTCGLECGFVSGKCWPQIYYTKTADECGWEHAGMPCTIIHVHVHVHVHDNAEMINNNSASIIRTFTYRCVHVWMWVSVCSFRVLYIRKSMIIVVAKFKCVV